MSGVAAILLAAGRSRRMQSDVPKVLHEVLGLPLVEYVVRAARAAGAGQVVVVVAPDHRDAIAEALVGYPEVALAVQEQPKGTAHAVLAAREALSGFNGTALVLLGDAPCVTPESLKALLAHHAERNASLSVLTGQAPDPTGYGRIVRGPDGDLAAIVEERDASPEVRAKTEINSGVFALELPAMWAVLDRIEPSPTSGEHYVTDAVQLARAQHLRAAAVAAARPEDVLGVNDRLQLAEATATLRRRILREHMKAGVTVVDPESTFVDARALIDPDVRLEPFVVIEGPCVLEKGARVGPFAHVRGGSVIEADARVGNFVEVVRSRVGQNARALHLSYIGDGALDAEVNVGAGTILANWDGVQHHPTRVGSKASLGAGTVLVAPTEVGPGARTGAGAVVVREKVPAGETWVGVPARPLSKPGGAQSMDLP